MRRGYTARQELTVTIPDRRVHGKQKQYRTIWASYDQSEDGEEPEWRCATCNRRLATQAKVRKEGYWQREFHHPIKQRYFPSPYQLEPSSTAHRKARQSRNHASNLVPVCSRCHGLWEDWENGRPHIGAWLFKDSTGQEADVTLWPSHELMDSQRTLWSSAELVAHRRQNRTCQSCYRSQRRTAVRYLYRTDGVSLRYTGPDVRAVHVIPPTEVPELAHVPRNLVLLCWDCLFGHSTKEGVMAPYKPCGWKDEPVREWVTELAPDLYREYSSQKNDQHPI